MHMLTYNTQLQFSNIGEITIIFPKQATNHKSDVNLCIPLLEKLTRMPS